MKSVEELIEEIEVMLDKAKPVLMSGGRVMIDANELRNIATNMRSALPDELRKAQAIVKNRSGIINDAEREADSIVRKAEERARRMVEQEEIVREANRRAEEKKAKAIAASHDIRKGARDFAEKRLRQTEDCMSQCLNELRRARQNLMAAQKAADYESNDSGSDD